MSKKENSALNLGKIHHVGIIVRDMEKAIEHYTSLGIGPFEPLWKKAGQGGIVKGEYRGQPYSGKALIRTVRIGDLELELLQPVQGESLVKESLEKRGEGINHIGFLVENLERDTQTMTEKGFSVITSVKFEHGGGCAFFDTDTVGGVLFELFQP